MSIKPERPMRTHWIPRTRNGRIAVGGFLVLQALAQPPIVYRFANRIEPWILGLPFLYAWLLGVYVAMIGVLIWAYVKRL